MNKIAHYAAAKAVRLHQANLATKGANPGEKGWLTSRDLYRLTSHRIRGLQSSYAAVQADTAMRRMRKIKRPMLSVYLDHAGFSHLGGTDHWCV